MRKLKERLAAIVGTLALMGLVYGCGSVKVWLCKEKHPGASTLGCLLSN